MPTTWLTTTNLQVREARREAASFNLPRQLARPGFGPGLKPIRTNLSVIARKTLMTLRLTELWQ